ncbi:MAG: hypothetical protein PHF64_08420 [Methanoregula sp.]|nr:hypothetical protein [Methanoregula sp.]
MSTRSSASTQGVSEVVATVMVILLVLVLVGVVFASLSGMLDPAKFQKTVYIAGTVATADLPREGRTSDQVLSFIAKAGDPFYLTGQTSGVTGTQVTFKAVTPSGATLYPDASSLSGNLYGKTLYLFPNNSPSSTQCDFRISQTDPGVPLRPMALGCWTILLIDEKVHVLANTYTARVTHGTTSLPVAGGFIGGSSSQLYAPDCTPIPQTIRGNLVTTDTGPGNMTIAHFNGVNTSISIPNSTTVSFGEAMAISMWMRPATNLTSSNPNNWGQCLGKGSITGGSNENDNYQLFQFGNKLVFEWNDKVTGIHYQAITTSTPVLATPNWNYIATSISDGEVKIYSNGVEQPLVYSQGVDPRSVNPPTPNPPVVRLRENSNNLTIGVQNAAPPNEFYYEGDIGALALYNRGLTETEILNNYEGFTA